MAVSFKYQGSFDRTTKFLTDASNSSKKTEQILRKYGEKGVKLLQQATPKDTGTTANSWTYEVKTTNSGCSLIFSNTNLADNGTPIAVLIQYGHGTKSGGYVQGRDYLNPVLKPLFEKLKDDVWKEVSE